MKAKTNLEARQHGAMEFSTAPVDLNTVREYRLGRLRKKMEEHEVAACCSLIRSIHDMQ